MLRGELPLKNEVAFHSAIGFRSIVMVDPMVVNAIFNLSLSCTNYLLLFRIVVGWGFAGFALAGLATMQSITSH